ncbi:phage integrase central domain-containing protein [Sphingobium yanoikuyae]|uniref:tyrosine-type recombinase/integrase n=1 Tax=Sphingobium yanoikuyae TaxID=13690 RepID=UPI0028B0E789|nr:integrase arm-type DNA-binding domain-containing protein [Sphingobium yanoikuyae]
MLTDQLLNALVAIDKPIKKSDGGGLHIYVVPLGRKRWRLAYRFDGKQKTIDGGEYPAVSLHRARVWREEMKALLSAGVDPIASKREAQFQANADKVTFEMLARDWIEARRAAWSPRYARLIEGRLANDILPVIGNQPARSIMPRTMLEALRVIEARGSYEMAHRIKNHCSEIFRFGIPDGRCETDPCRDLTAAMIKPPPVRHRAKVEIKDLPEFFARLDADSGSEMSHFALRWTILTMVRTQETRFAQWSEFEDLGGDEPLWRIPAERMKMRSEHLVPLPPQAVELLRKIRDINCYGRAGNERLGKYLFPVAGSRSDTISENRMLDIMYRIGLRGKATVHGFRSLASTVLNESGFFMPDWIEMQLAHMPRGVRGVYNAARYLSHRRKMMAWWANYLDAAEVAAPFALEGFKSAGKKTESSLAWFLREW